MTRRRLAAWSLLFAVVLLAGCSEQQKLITQLRSENTSLRGNVASRDTEIARLQQELRGSEEGLGEARLKSDEWQAKYEAARNVLPREHGAIPPELLRKFIEIAHAGGPFEMGPTGGLKASSDILFDPGRVELKPAGQAALRDIAPKLREILTDKRVMLRVDGHTDSTAIRASGWLDNLHLSMMRARAVVDFLKKQGLPSNAMFAAGFGEYHPVASNETDEGKAQNRRVELSLVSVTGPLGMPTE